MIKAADSSCAAELQGLRGLPLLVTGASGFIGGAVARLAAASGAEVRGLVRDGASARGLAASGVEPVRGGLGDGAALAAALRGRVLLHFAWDMRAGAAANLAAFEALLGAAARAGVRRVVHASSVVVHDGWPDADISRDSPVTPPPGPPASYRAAKIAAEARLRRFARETGAAVALLRPTLVCGKGSRLWTGAVAERLLAGPVVLPEGIDGLCHFVDVADVARAALRAVLAGPGPGEARAYLVSGPAPVTWAEFYRAHAARLGRGATVREPLAALQARLGPADAAPAGPSAAARAGALARRLLGPGPVEALGRRLRALRGTAGDGVHRPDRSLLALYLGQGRIDLAATRAELGWVPRTDLEASLDGSFGASPGTSHGNPA